MNVFIFYCFVCRVLIEKITANLIFLRKEIIMSTGMIDKEKLVADLDSICDKGIELLEKDTFESIDFSKLKVMKVVAPFISAKVCLIQQENVVTRIQLVRDRMKQLGYDEPKASLTA